MLRLAYLGVTNAFALLRLLPMSDRDKDVEILAVRHQLTVLHRQLGTERVRFDPSDRALLAALLHRLPRDVLHRGRLPVRPDKVLRWHRDLLARRHGHLSRPKRPGRPPDCTFRSPAGATPGTGEPELAARAVWASAVTSRCSLLPKTGCFLREQWACTRWSAPGPWRKASSHQAQARDLDAGVNAGPMLALAQIS